MPSSRDRTDVAGLRILVVEDETLVAINLESMLEDLGCIVACLAMRYEQAERMVEDASGIDVAVLDVNIGGRKVFPIAQRLADKGVSLLFATGYGRAGLPDEWQDRPVLQKPYTDEDLARGLGQARRPGAAARTGDAR